MASVSKAVITEGQITEGQGQTTEGQTVKFMDRRSNHRSEGQILKWFEDHTFL